MTTLIDTVLPMLVVFVMTIVGMDLRFEDFRRMRQYPVLVPGIVIGHWILLTLAAGLTGRVLDLPPEVTAGALLVAAAPVAALSGYYTQLAGGHLALAVTVAGVSNVLAVVITPLVATLGFWWFLDAGGAFALPSGKIAQQTVVGLLLPLLAGMLIRHHAAAWTGRWRGPLQGMGVIGIVAVLAMVVVNQFAAIRAQFGVLLRASLLFTLAMLVAGLMVAKIATRPGKDQLALVWGFPARNVAVAALIATSALGQVAMASFIAVLFATQVALLIPLALWLRRRSSPPRHGAPA